MVEKVRRNVCRGSEEWAESKVSGYNWGGEFGGRNEFKSLIQVQGVLPRRGVVRRGGSSYASGGLLCGGGLGEEGADGSFHGFHLASGARGSSAYADRFVRLHIGGEHLALQFFGV